MIISVKVKTNARRNEVRQVGVRAYEVLVNEPPREGLANEAVIALIAAHFEKPKRAVKIKSGSTSKNKVIIIDE